MNPDEKQLEQVFRQLTSDDGDSQETRIQRARKALDLIERVRVNQSETQKNTPSPCETLPADTFGIPDDPLPSQFGRFKIRKKLGSGGFGIVFHAHDPKLNRDIALKIPRVEQVASSEMRDRFEREARAAAALDHPHILPVFESGSVGSVSYIVTQLYEGHTLEERLQCATVPISHRAAARLLSILAAAMDHAHSRGVLHRDLKPANILLRGEAVAHGNKWLDTARIADFGLARQLGERSGHSVTGAIIGTPDYMSPEQAHGQNRDVTTSSDIYALGAIFYELLGGQPPFRSSSLLQTLDAVRSKEPKRLRSLDSSVPADLEAICLKCLEKDPNARYLSAAQLRNDLQAWLDGRPVEARPITSVQRLVRWSRRNPVVSGLGTALAILLLVSTVWIWRERNIAQANFQTSQRNFQAAELARQAATRNFAWAEENFQRSQDAVEILLTQVGKRLAEVPGAQNARREILTAALAHYQDMLDEKAEDPWIRYQVADAHLNVAVIQHHLGEWETANHAIDQAINISMQLSDNEPHPDFVRQLAVSEAVKSHILLSQKKYGNSKQAAARSLQAWERLPPEELSLADRSKVLDSKTALAIASGRSGDKQESLVLYRETIEDYRQLQQLQPDNPDTLRNLAGCFNNLGNLLARSFNDRQQALVNVSDAVAILEGLLEQRPNDVETKNFLANCRLSLALWQRDSEEFLELLEQAITLKKELAESFPNVPRYALNYSSVLDDKATHLNRLGKSAEAESIGRRVIKVRRGLASRFPEVASYHHLLGNSLNNLAQALNNLKRTPEAIDLIHEAIEHQSTALQIEPLNQRIKTSLAKHHANLALSYLTAGDYRSAAIMAGRIPEHRDDPDYWLLTAKLLGRCLENAQHDIVVNQNEHQDLMSQYKAQTIGLLQHCLNDPRFEGREQQVRQDADLRSLADDPEFLELVY